MDLVQALRPRPSDRSQHHEPLAGETGFTGPGHPGQALRVRTYRAVGRPRVRFLRQTPPSAQA